MNILLRLTTILIFLFNLFTITLNAQIDESFKRSFGHKLEGFCYGREVKTKIGRIGKILDVEARCPGITIFSCYMKVKIEFLNKEIDSVIIQEGENHLTFVNPYFKC